MVLDIFGHKVLDTIHHNLMVFPMVFWKRIRFPMKIGLSEPEEAAPERRRS